MAKHLADQSATTFVRETQAVQAAMNPTAVNMFPGFGRHRMDGIWNPITGITTPRVTEEEKAA